MGKYQFGKRTLKSLGYDVSKKEFLNSPYLQEQAMLDLLNHNKKILKNYIDYWDGKTINGRSNYRKWNTYCSTLGWTR